MGVDPLSDVLRALRVTGVLVLNDTYKLPWAVGVPESSRLAQLADMKPTDWAVAFHLVQQGSLELSDEHGSTTEAGEGDLLIAFGGSPHELSAGDTGAAITLETLMAAPATATELQPQGPRVADTGHGNERVTTLLCGVFNLGSRQNSPLVGSVPPIVRIRSGQDGSFDALTLLLRREATKLGPGADYAISRILELLCAEALRQVAETTVSREPGWLKALADPAVFAAMSAIHHNPGRNWTVSDLADHAALSSSRLTARFREALGESPMSYAAKWRMTIASQMLRESDNQIQTIAAHVGYTSQPSFSRAFQNVYGCSPSEYRRDG